MKKHSRRQSHEDHSMHNATPSYMNKLNNFEDMKNDMSPRMDDYQQPMSTFSQAQFGKTLEYIERKDRHLNENASDIRRQQYNGRYS